MCHRKRLPLVNIQPNPLFFAFPFGGGWRGTEAVTTAPTRNRLEVESLTWVRIPPSPPLHTKSGFAPAAVRAATAPAHPTFRSLNPIAPAVALQRARRCMEFARQFAAQFRVLGRLSGCSRASNQSSRRILPEARSRARSKASGRTLPSALHLLLMDIYPA